MLFLERWDPHPASVLGAQGLAGSLIGGVHTGLVPASPRPTLVLAGARGASEVGCISKGVAPKKTWALPGPPSPKPCNPPSPSQSRVRDVTLAGARLESPHSSSSTRIPRSGSWEILRVSLYGHPGFPLRMR